jgi:RNA polymerase sigma factor (sigma-70 family)
MESPTIRSRLVALHSDCVGWAMVCCRQDLEAAREVVQMSYLKVLEGRARWDGLAEFRTWLFAVIRNTAAARRRRVWLRAGLLARLRARPAVPEPLPDPEASAAAAEAVGQLRRALARLSRRQREVLHLVFYQGMTIDDTAAVLGLAPGTVRLHYERGKRGLRRLLPPEVQR